MLTDTRGASRAAPHRSGLTRDDAVLSGAVVTMGLLAGLFYGYACSVMPGLRASSDRTVVEAMRNINSAIQNPVFFATFMGAPVLAVWAYVDERRRGAPSVARWLLCGVVLAGICLVVTASRNIPLNTALERAGDPDAIVDIAKARHDFETPWIVWNVVRTVAVAGAFGCLARALQLRSRRGSQR